MAKYRTAMGRVVDMSVLASKNEKTRAVGNMKVNARGDTIDASGKVIKPATSKVNDAYSKTVGNKAAQPVSRVPRKGNDPVKASTPAPLPSRTGANQQIPEPLNEVEKELEDDLDYDLEVEQIKAQETKSK